MPNVLESDGPKCIRKLSSIYVNRAGQIPHNKSAPRSKKANQSNSNLIIVGRRALTASTRTDNVKTSRRRCIRISRSESTNDSAESQPIYIVSTRHLTFDGNDVIHLSCSSDSFLTLRLSQRTVTRRPKTEREGPEVPVA